MGIPLPYCGWHRFCTCIVHSFAIFCQGTGTPTRSLDALVTQRQVYKLYVHTARPSPITSDITSGRGPGLLCEGEYHSVCFWAL